MTTSKKYQQQQRYQENEVLENAAQILLIVSLFTNRYFLSS